MNILLASPTPSILNIFSFDVFLLILGLINLWTSLPVLNVKCSSTQLCFECLISSWWGHLEGKEFFHKVLSLLQIARLAWSFEGSSLSQFSPAFSASWHVDIFHSCPFPLVNVFISSDDGMRREPYPSFTNIWLRLSPGHFYLTIPRPRPGNF